jgi:S1-C subfamily serine protease
MLLAVVAALSWVGMSLLGLCWRLWCAASWRARLIGVGSAAFVVLLAVVVAGWMRAGKGGDIAMNASFQASDSQELLSDAPEEEEPDAQDAEPPPTNTSLQSTVLDKVKKATVLVRVKLKSGREGSGSGFFAIEPGTLLTNAHVVGMLHADAAPPEKVEVVLNSGERDERVYPGTLVTVDQNSDLAVLRVTPENGKTLPAPLDIGLARRLRETQQVFIFGFPFGEQLGKNITVSPSAVSSLRKDAEGKLAKVQVNGGMNPGNSGGPVVDGNGKVVGVAVSGIANTQLNFAIPAETATTLLNGRIASMSVGASTRKEGKIAVPVTLQTLDPLKRISKLAVDWWIGDPGRPRPPTSRRPAPRDGDINPRRTATVSAGSDGAPGQTELLLEALPTSGKVLWVQPMLTDGTGKSRWLAAVAQPVEHPVEPRAATVTVNHEKGAASIRLASKSTFRLRDPDGEGHSIRLDIGTTLGEDCESVDRNGRGVFRLDVGKFDLSVNVDGESKQVSSRLADILQEMEKVHMQFTLDRQGNLSGQRVDASRVSKEAQAPVEKFAELIVSSIDAAVVPIPNGELAMQPGQSWQARRALPIDSLESHQSSDVDMTYTFRGIRPYKGGELAVIDLRGALRAAQQRGGSIKGETRGTAQVDTKTGRVMQAQASVDVELELTFRKHSVNSSGKLEVRLRREE